jgi:hypothetical protein
MGKKLNFCRLRRSETQESSKSVDLGSEDKSLSFFAVDKVGMDVGSSERKRKKYFA